MERTLVSSTPWHDTDNGKYWVVLRKGSETHRVELKG